MKMTDLRSTLNPIAALMFFSMLLSACCTDGVRREVRTLPEEEWIGMLSSMFDDITLRLNNYTPNDHEFEESDEKAFYKPNDSFFRLDALDVSLTFDIPVQRSDPYSLYINDINSTSFTPGTRGGSALVTIILEDDGYEVIGNCVNNVACICGDPKVHLNDMRLDVLLSFGARAGRLIITETNVEMTSTFEEEGPCHDNVCAFACDMIAPDRESQAREQIELQVAQYFMNNRVIVETLFNEHIRNLGVTEDITSVTISGRGDLLLTVEYEDSCE